MDDFKDAGDKVYRERRCKSCGHEFETVETVVNKDRIELRGLKL